MPEKLSKDNIISPEPAEDRELEQDYKAQSEAIFYEEESKKAFINRIRLLNESLKQDIKARKKYANKIFWLICGWLIAVFVLLLFQGFEIWEFKLSEGIMIAILTGLSVNILGIFIVVANYIFPKNSQSFKQRLEQLNSIFGWLNHKNDIVD